VSATDPITGISGSEQGRSSRSRKEFEKLIKLLEDRNLVSVQTNLGLYKDLCLTSLNVSQDKDTSLSVHFTAEFTELIVVDRLLETLDKDKIPNDEQIEEQSAGSRGVVILSDTTEREVETKKYAKRTASRFEYGDKALTQLDSDQELLVRKMLTGVYK
jgi:hypothetical protein